MNAADLAIAAGAGVVGFGLIWGLFGLIRQQRAAPVAMSDSEPRAAVESRDTLSVAELGRTWQALLGVAAAASPEEIEAGYHARLAECDRIRFSASASAPEKQSAETRRSQVSEAYEFIRKVRH
jgi:hypothetical protein